MVAPDGRSGGSPIAALRAELEASRDVLRALLTDAQQSGELAAAASIARELRITNRELADLAGPAEGSTVDALAARRAARQSAASSS